MDLARYVVDAVVLEGRSYREVARAHGVSKSWVGKLVGRFRAGGYAAIEPRSRAAKRIPHRTPDEVEDEIVALRKELDDLGVDAGAATIHYHLGKRHEARPLGVHDLAGAAPARLRHPAAAQATPELLDPLRGPAAERVLAVRRDALAARRRHRGRDRELPRRPLPPGRGGPSRPADATAPTVAGGVPSAGARWGFPAALLTDNGCVYTTWHRGGPNVMQTELLALWASTTATPVPTTPRPAARSSASTRR